MPKPKPNAKQLPEAQDIVRVERMGELVGSVIEISTQNGSTYTGLLVKAPVIDKVFFASIQDDDGKITNVNTAFIASFSVLTLAKAKVVDVTKNLPCEGRKDIKQCTFAAQNFEPLCNGCPGKQRRADPLKLAEQGKANVNVETEDEPDNDEDAEQ